MGSFSNNQDVGFLQNFKRPKLEFVGTISKTCGAAVTRTNSSGIEHDITVYPLEENATMDFASRKYPPPRILQEFPVQRDFPASCQNQNLGHRSNLVNGKLMFGVNRVKKNVIVDFACQKYPPPRIMKDFSVRRDFPIGCKNQKFGHHSDLTNGKLMVDIEPFQASNTMKSRESEQNRISVNHSKETVEVNFVHRKCPPSRILKKFPHRDFPVGCEKQNFGHLLRSTNGKSLKKFPLRQDFLVGCKKQKFAYLSNSINGKSLVDVKPLVVEDGIDFDCNQVKETLQSFHDICFNLMQDSVTSATTNIPMKAAMLLRMQLKWVFTSKRLGTIPGVNVGDMFQWVAELNVIGLHRQFYNGIDYMNIGGKIVATSIVASGRYYNDVEFSNVLIYSGQGGNSIYKGKQLEDQKLERGNLALKNSMEAKTPVRVIRGFKLSKSSNLIGMSGMKIFNRVYVYDGLYLVDGYWQERGRFGKLVFMFLLKRISGQLRCTFGKMSEFEDSTFDKEDYFFYKYKMSLMREREDDSEPRVLDD